MTTALLLHSSNIAFATLTLLLAIAAMQKISWGYPGQRAHALSLIAVFCFYLLPNIMAIILTVQAGHGVTDGDPDHWILYGSLATALFFWALGTWVAYRGFSLVDALVLAALAAVVAIRLALLA